MAALCPQTGTFVTYCELDGLNPMDGEGTYGGACTRGRNRCSSTAGRSVYVQARATREFLHDLLGRLSGYAHVSSRDPNAE
jgi:hypothetical protein